jgi:hypothetical protein
MLKNCCKNDCVQYAALRNQRGIALFSLRAENSVVLLIFTKKIRWDKIFAHLIFSFMEVKGIKTLTSLRIDLSFCPVWRYAESASSQPFGLRL